MPMIQVQLLKGRSIDQKQNMTREMTEVFVRHCGGEASEVNIIIQEVEAANWACGGVLCSDIAEHRPNSSSGASGPA